MSSGPAALRALARPARNAAADALRPLAAAARWRSRHLAPPRRHPLAGELVVTLTSFPARFATLHLTLWTLLTQSQRPDAVILWIAHADRAALPAGVRELEGQGLSIRYCDDLRSYKKLVPALHAHPDAFLVTADDDLYYWRTWLDELTAAWRPGDGLVCHRAHRIGWATDGQPLPYRAWQANIAACPPAADVFPTTGGGVLFPPGSLDARATDPGLFSALCPSADDIWFYWMARLRGRLTRKVGRRRPFRPWRGSQSASLYAINANPDTGNDMQIARMAAHFGWPSA